MKMNKEQLLALLKRTIEAVEQDDTIEGRIAYTAMPSEQLDVELGVGEFEVDAAVRYGNSEGQGSMMLATPSKQKYVHFFTLPLFGKFQMMEGHLVFEKTGSEQARELKADGTQDPFKTPLAMEKHDHVKPYVG